jgi:hypothetical protein
LDHLGPEQDQQPTGVAHSRIAANLKETDALERQIQRQ